MGFGQDKGVAWTTASRRVMSTACTPLPEGTGEGGEGAGPQTAPPPRLARIRGVWASFLQIPSFYEAAKGSPGWTRAAPRVV